MNRDQATLRAYEYIEHLVCAVINDSRIPDMSALSEYEKSFVVAWYRSFKRSVSRRRNNIVAGFTSGNKRSLKRAKPRIKRVR